ncbi:MAG: NEW3 domain-containing protein [Candidatus Micrarchaeia archaeon]
MENNRNMASRLMAFALFALVAISGLGFASVNPKLQLLNATLSETPAQPGHVLALSLHIKSMESDNCAERVAVQVAVSYPLSVRGADTQYVELLCSRDSDSKGTFTFYLPVDNLATSGTYPVSVSTTYEKKFTKLSESNTVNVQVGGVPSFAASVAASSPVDIYPGDTAQVTVAFQNTGPSPAQSAFASAESRGVQVKWAGQTQSIGQVLARGSANAVFTIEAPKDLEAGTYPLNVKLAYSDQYGNNGTKGFTFYVPVKPKADFVADASSANLLPGQKKEVSVALTNTGKQEARKVEVRIRPIYPFSTDGTVRYIESLQPGETVNLTYVITVDKDATSGGQLVGTIVNFEDPQGRKFSDTADFAMPVRMPTLVEELVAYWYLVAAGVLAVAFAVSKKMGGKKK